MRSWKFSVKYFLQLDKEGKLSFIIGYLFNTRDSGETVIKCKSKLISKIEVKEILKLLHSDYSDLGMYIEVHNSTYHTFLRMMNPFNRSIDYSTYTGAYNHVYAANHFMGNIDLFSYNHLKTKSGAIDLKLYIINDLLHEVRHAYQIKHKKDKYNQCHKNYINGGSTGYEEQWVERDANAFATRMMNKYHSEINNILGISYNWENTWGYFKKV